MIHTRTATRPAFDRLAVLVDVPCRFGHLSAEFITIACRATPLFTVIIRYLFHSYSFKPRIVIKILHGMDTNV
jgi:hypothetical protein